MARLKSAGLFCMINRLCTHPNCDEFAEPDQTRCAEHLPQQRANRQEQWRKAQSAPEVVAWRRLYKKARWIRSRLLYLRKFPLCQHCAEVGIVKAAQEVDHIKPHRGCEKLFWDAENWQGLCKPCHSRKTASETLHRPDPE